MGAFQPRISSLIFVEALLSPCTIIRFAVLWSTSVGGSYRQSVWSFSSSELLSYVVVRYRTCIKINLKNHFFGAGITIITVIAVPVTARAR